MWPATYRNCAVMGTPAFLLCYGFIIADIQGDKPDFQSSQTKKQGDKVYFKPLCGPHRRQNRAKSASYPAPTGTKGTRVPCILGTQARQGCPIPGCNPTPQHAADGGRQARCPVPAPKPQPRRSPPAAGWAVAGGRGHPVLKGRPRPPKTSSNGLCRARRSPAQGTRYRPWQTAPAAPAQPDGGNKQTYKRPLYSMEE